MTLDAICTLRIEGVRTTNVGTKITGRHKPENHPKQSKDVKNRVRTPGIFVRIPGTGLASCGSKWYNRTMIVKVAGKYVRKEFVAALVCLSLIGNCVYGTVLCFGADGHVEFESAFHEQCRDHVHSQSTNHHHSSKGEHKHDKHCHNGQCVDVPISFGLAKISQTPEQLDSALVAFAADVIVAAEQADCSEHLPASNTFLAGSYFSSLRTVILLA